MSYDATPLNSQIDYLNVHMDYGLELSENWRVQMAYDWLQVDILQEDEYPLAWGDALGSNRLNAEYQNSTYTGELTYKETIGNHRLTGGLKARYKTLDSFKKDGRDALVTPLTSETITSLFFQDQYAWSENELLTLGISYNYMSRNGGIEDDSLLHLRLGYLYSSNSRSYKTYVYRTQFSLEPFTRYLEYEKYQDVALQTTIGITQELAYNDENYALRLKLLYMQDENGLLANKIENFKDNTKYFFSIFNYDYDFDVNNKINLQVYYAKYSNLLNTDTLEDISGYLSFINSYDNFDFYNGVVWHRNSLDWENYFDLTSSISWNINEDLTVTLKGDNLLNKAKATNLFRVNPVTGDFLSPLKISPIDQRITIELEYLF